MTSASFPIDTLYPPAARRWEPLAQEPIWDRSVFVRWAGGATAALMAAVSLLLLGIFRVVWTQTWATFAASGACWITFAVLTIAATSARARALHIAYENLERQKLATSEPNGELQSLIAVNRGDMRAYQELARAQARTSYRWSLAAAGAALTMLIGGAVVVIAVDSTLDKAAIAGLTGLTGALASYVARTYLRIYERSQQQLNFYFEQPLLMSYVLQAERLAARVEDPEERAAVLKQVIGRLVDAAGQTIDRP